jgi:hypothetical protein
MADALSKKIAELRFYVNYMPVAKNARTRTPSKCITFYGGKAAVLHPLA